MVTNNNLRCGTCVHFQDGPAHPKFETICSSIGVRDYAVAPDCYSPAPRQIVRAPVDVGAIGNLLRNLSGNQMQVLGQLMTQSVALEEIDLKFGQPVYVNLGGGEYLTNYFKGYVVGMTHVAGEGRQKVPHVYVSSDLTFADAELPEYRSLLCLMPESLTTVSSFKGIRESLVEENRLEAPPKEGAKHTMPLGVWLNNACPMPEAEPDLYEPPTLDSAPTAWLDPYSVSDMENFKIDSPLKRKRDKTVIIIDSEAKRKQAERASKKLNIVKVTNADGSTTRTIVSTDSRREATAEMFPAMPQIYRR